GESRYKNVTRSHLTRLPAPAPIFPAMSVMRELQRSVRAEQSSARFDPYLPRTAAGFKRPEALLAFQEKHTMAHPAGHWDTKRIPEALGGRAATRLQCKFDQAEKFISEQSPPSCGYELATR